jgi:mannose-6-phosphate isomerase-like protein (cupin superfamily)
MPWESKQLPAEPDVVAPDGSFVRILLRLQGGSMAHFELPAGKTSVAVVHQTVEEIWFFLGGDGEMWRSDGDEDCVPVRAGTCITIPKRTRFQFRAHGSEPLTAVAITMPPWPGIGDGESTEVDGAWEPTVAAGPPSGSV